MYAIWNNMEPISPGKFKFGKVTVDHTNLCRYKYEIFKYTFVIQPLPIILQIITLHF